MSSATRPPTGAMATLAEDQQRPLEGAEHGVEDDMKMSRMVMGQTIMQAARAALLALVLAGPVDLVAGRELDLLVDLGDGLFDGGAEVAVADAVLDGDVALAAFAVDLFGAVFAT
jgi:hypothetical protein